MFKIHDFKFSFNVFKVIDGVEEVKVDYENISIDPGDNEHKSPDYLKKQPLGKTPTFEHEEKTLFEIASICSYMALVKRSSIGPNKTFSKDPELISGPIFLRYI